MLSVRRLFEFEDFHWFPSVIRDGGTDHLRYLLSTLKTYDAIIPLLASALEQTRETVMVDLCAGGGGSIEQVRQGVEILTRRETSVVLTDMFPNVPAFRYLHERSNGLIKFREDSIDAVNVPGELTGMRTMFSAVHHFDEGTLRRILTNAVENRSGIALFDLGETGIAPVGIPLLWLVNALAFLLCTPFYRPFRLSRLVFTYLLPLIPLYTLWDGSVSLLRLYKPEALLSIAESIDAQGYAWIAGTARNKWGPRVSYLIGIHAARPAA